MWHLILVLHLRGEPVPVMYLNRASCVTASIRVGEKYGLKAMCRQGLLIEIRKGKNDV